MLTVSWGARLCRFVKRDQLFRGTFSLHLSWRQFLRNTGMYDVTSKNTVISQSRQWRPQNSQTAVTLNNFHLQEALTIFILMITPGIGSLQWHKEFRENQIICQFTNIKQQRRIRYDVGKNWIAPAGNRKHTRPICSSSLYERTNHASTIANRYTVCLNRDA